MQSRDYEARKRDHIRHALDAANQASGLSGLERIRLCHEALPDLDFSEVTLESVLLGSDARTPFFVAAITAGHTEAEAINRVLGQACAKRGWTFGLGSQRKELEALEKKGADPLFEDILRLRKGAPDLTILSNIGITQVIATPTPLLARLVEQTGAKALVIHTNPLQEALQAEGTPSFKGALEALKRVCAELGKPVVLKETGSGFSGGTLERLHRIGLAAIDVSGLGGTHWGRVEGARVREKNVMDARAKAAEVFANWGESTLDSVFNARQSLSGVELWASGGVRSGVDAAKLLALGATQVGYAQPALEAALQGAEALENWMQQQEFELKLALFCTGSRSPAALARKIGVWKEAYAYGF